MKPFIFPKVHVQTIRTEKKHFAKNVLRKFLHWTREKVLKVSNRVKPFKLPRQKSFPVE